MKTETKTAALAKFQKDAVRQLTRLGREHEKAAAKIRKEVEIYCGVQLGRYDYHCDRLSD